MFAEISIRTNIKKYRGMLVSKGFGLGLYRPLCLFSLCGLIMIGEGGMD